MKDFVQKIIKVKKGFFPIGKSLFVFEGRDDTIYFIIYKEEFAISVMEIYDDVLNRIPEHYRLLPEIRSADLLA